MKNGWDRRNMIRRSRLALIGLIALLVGGVMGESCEQEEILYLLEQAPGQAELILKRKSFDRVLADPDLDPEVRDKLEFVLEVKRYGVDQIGLLKNKNYEVYVEIDREAVSWNLTACETLHMTPVTWQFPVVGEMPYLGFFKKEDALKKADELTAQGDDVYLRTAGAYSMLGIMSDPLYSPLTNLKKADLANLVIHEMLHGTVFISGQMNFNENLALFVGNQGSYDFLAERFGADSEEAGYAKGSNIDDETFSRELMALFNELDAMYKSGISDEEKMTRKQEIIAEHKRHFREEVLPAMETTAYQGWPDKDINNATIYSRVVYYHDLSLYARLYEAMNQDLKAMVDFFKEVQEMEGVDAEKFAREWLEKQ